MQRVVSVFREQLPLLCIGVYRVQLTHGRLEAMAVEAAGQSTFELRRHVQLPEGSLAEILVWARRSAVLRRADAAEAPTIRPLFDLVASDRSGDLMIGGLADTTAVHGLVFFAASEPDAFTSEHAHLLSACLEPLTVAVLNDRRLGEMNALREAAEADKASLLRRLGRDSVRDSIVGAESGLKPVLERSMIVAPTDLPVLILGETGSGKEVVARVIHEHSPQRSGPFLRVNCGAIPSELVDSELFGHEKGSFTGASALRKGWFERADGGTLFLDEVGELPHQAQVRLLRVLQDGTFERVGGHGTLKIDVRVIAATHRNLPGMIAEGRFREDLWYRMAAFLIELPPLRDRPEDIPAMANHFAQRAARRFGFPPLNVSPEDMGLLFEYVWPGNVRELAAVIDRAVILGQGKKVEVGQAMGMPTGPARTAAAFTPKAYLAPTASDGASRSLDEISREHIERVLAQTHGRIEGPDGAAKLLNINPHTLRARMRKFGIDWARFRAR